MNLSERRGMFSAMQQTQHDNSTAAEQLINAHDGDVALLYIFSRHTGSYDLEEAARALCRTMQELRAAEEKLRRMGLWRENAAASPGSAAVTSPTVSAEQPRFIPPDGEELPPFTAQEIARLSDGDSAFRDIITEATQGKGKQLTAPELGVLAGVYTHLGLPAEVIYLLLHHCLELAEARQPGSRPGWRSIQNEAFRWANLELLTHEQVEDYLRREADRSSALGRIQALLGLGGRALTAPEKKNLLSWLDMGFDEGAIQLAYERTVYNTGSLKWAYMNKILQRWHQSGWHDRATIEEKDSRRTPASSSASGSEDISFEELDRILNRI